MMKDNTLMLGDNLGFLKELTDDSVDLVYLDPPFNSNRDRVTVGMRSQVRCFVDVWKGGSPEYLEFLFDRLVELRRILKSTGSLYLHCDPTESHYVKVMMDRVFGRKNFRNEIAWCYSGPANTKRYFPRKHDIILFYAMSDEYTHNETRVPHGGKLSVGGKSSWAGSKRDATVYTQRGKLLEDWWRDIPALQRNERERCGFPTQKPLRLLERIIQASSNKGDLVLDPFVGSGTTAMAAHRLERRFIGMDMSKGAIDTATTRLNRAGVSFKTFQTTCPAPELDLHVIGSIVTAVFRSGSSQVVNFTWWVDRSADNNAPAIPIDGRGKQDLARYLSDGEYHLIMCRATDDRGLEATRSIAVRLDD